MTKSIKSKTALVTGASKGIGLKIAHILAKRGYNIVICSRNNTELEKAQKSIESFGVKCLALKLDVSNYSQCKSLIGKTIKQFRKIDLLVNNAGIQGPIGNLWQNDLKKWKETIDINLMGVVYMTHLVLPYMLKQKSGMIINLSGGGAAYARPFFSAYSCSKTALVRLTETLTQELKGKNVLVFSIAPGAIWTNMTKTVLKSGARILDKKSINELELLKKTTELSFNKLEKLFMYLLYKRPKALSGKLIHVNEVEDIQKMKNKIKEDSGLLRRISFK